MYKMCKSEQSAKRQRELEQHLLILLKTVRFDDISVSDICTQANIPRKTFYRYFSGKDGALHALIDHTLLELETFPYLGNTTNCSVYKRELLRFFRFWLEKKSIIEALTFSGLSNVLVTRTIDYALSNAASAHINLQNNETRMWEYGITFGISGLMSMVLNWYNSGYQLSVEQLAEISEKLLTNPLIHK